MNNIIPRNINILFVNDYDYFLHLSSCTYYQESTPATAYHGAVGCFRNYARPNRGPRPNHQIHKYWTSGYNNSTWWHLVQRTSSTQNWRPQFRDPQSHQSPTSRSIPALAHQFSEETPSAPSQMRWLWPSMTFTKAYWRKTNYHWLRWWNERPRAQLQQHRRA